MMREYANNYTNSAYKIIEEKAFYCVELKDILTESSIKFAQKKAPLYNDYTDEHKRRVTLTLKSFLLTIIKNTLLSEYAIYRNYLIKENNKIDPSRESVVIRAKRDYHLKHLT